MIWVIWKGSVSGGCVEGAVIGEAADLLRLEMLKFLNMAFLARVTGDWVGMRRYNKDISS